MDQSNIDLGVDEEIITNQKSRKKVILNPLNNNKTSSNTAMSSTTGSFFPSKTHNSNTSQGRLSPLHRKNSESTLEKSKTHNLKLKEQFEESGLFSNFFDKRRLQQIEFLPTNLTNNFISKDNHKNHYGVDGISVYSLKQGNELLKKNFNLSIGQSADQPKRFMVRKIKLKKQEFEDNNETAERRHSDEDNQSSKSSNNYSNDNQALMQLKRAQFGSNFGHSNNNAMVNLQNLLASSVSPTDQMGSRTGSERTFQIKKTNRDSTGGSNSIDPKKRMNSTKNNFQNNNFQMNNEQNNPANFKNKGRKQVEMREKKLQNNMEKDKKQKKQGEQSLGNGRYDNNSIPPMLPDFFVEQKKQLPLFTLNFNKTLETRLLLNNLVPQ